MKPLGDTIRGEYMLFGFRHLQARRIVRIGGFVQAVATAVF